MGKPPPAGDDGAPETLSPDSRWVEESLAQPRTPPLHGSGMRLRNLVLLGLVGAALLALWLRMLAGQPTLHLVLVPGAQGQAVLAASREPALQGLVGAVVLSLQGQGLPPVAARPVQPEHTPRWMVDDAERQALQVWRAQLAQALHQPTLALQLQDGSRVTLAPQPRSLAGLGAMCWLFSALALALCGVAAVVLLDQPTPASALYAVMAGSQALNLLLIGADALPGLGPAGPFEAANLPLRLLSDALGAAALVHALALYPTRLPHAPWLAGLAWTVALVMAAVAWWWPPAGLWWWMQALMLGSGVAAAWVLRSSMRHNPAPLTAMLLRLALAGTGTLALLTLAIALADRAGLPQLRVATLGSAVWLVFYASLLMLVPFLARSRRVLREFAALAGIATVAASLDLLFITVLGIGQLAAIALALAVSLLLYAVARQWIMDHLSGSGRMSAERMFETLYRAARALEQAPAQAGEQLSVLLREVFDPLEIARSARPGSRIRVAIDGSTLVVPVPQLSDDAPAAGTIVLRFAHRGRHLFTTEDAQLCGRILEQLGRAVAHDRAVEQGRSEERARIAQDLHDDIGARLLTLMYKTPDPEIESYIRHTLQDLKTLTRGLAASNHRLSHAAAEWKADLSQRLNATGCDLRWSFSADRDLTLNVVQWSSLTRVLRELVNNIIAHAQASQVEVSLSLERGRILLVVSDDGVGRTPTAWAHGLGLGGVRKRVKLLGGQVSWLEREGRGIRCEVRAQLLPDAPDLHQTSPRPTPP